MAQSYAGFKKIWRLSWSILALGFIYFDTYSACKTLRCSRSVASVSSFLVFYFLFFWVLLFLLCFFVFLGYSPFFTISVKTQCQKKPTRLIYLPFFYNVKRKWNWEMFVGVGHFTTMLSYGLLLMLNNPDDNLDKRIFSELGITICENIPIFLN